MYSSGLNIEVQGALLQVAALSETLNWEPLQAETSVQSELRSRLDPWSTMILIKMSIDKWSTDGETMMSNANFQDHW